jgi:hypothetical protein
MWTVFLTRRRATILRRRIRRPNVVVRLASPIVRSIFVRHRTTHVTPVVLRTIHFVRLSLRTRYSAILDVAVTRTVIHAMVSYRSRWPLIVSAEFSGT